MLQKSATSQETAAKVIRAAKLRKLAAWRFRGAGYLVGTRPNETTTSFGLQKKMPVNQRKGWPKFYRLKGEFNSTVIAGTGAGKGVSVVCPACMLHEGQLICIDPKGEITQVVARRRREIGDQVVIIDPFEVLGPNTGFLNPLDVIPMLAGAGPVDDLAETLAADLGAGHEVTRDIFWWNTATALLAGLLAYVTTHPDPAKRTLNTVVDLLGQDDPVYGLAVKLDTEGKTMNRFAYRRISEFLQIPDSSAGATRSCVLASAKQMIHCLEAERVARTLEKSSFNLRDLCAGDAPLTVMIVFPPEKSHSHRGLLRLLLSTCILPLWRRTHIPARRTLVVLDEAANIGKLDLLPLLYSYGRGFGVSTLSVWQSLGQLSDVYPTVWRVIVENSLLQTFGLHPVAIGSMAALLGVKQEVIRDLAPSQQLVAMPSGPPMVLDRVDYRTNPLLSAMADRNSRYDDMQTVELVHLFK